MSDTDHDWGASIGHRHRGNGPSYSGQRNCHVRTRGRSGGRRGRTPPRQDRTITLGNRQATAFITAPGVDAQTLADAAQLSSLPDETPEGRSIVVLAKEKYGLRERDIQALGAKFIPFSAHTRMSGVDMEGREVRKGAPDAVEDYVKGKGVTSLSILRPLWRKLLAQVQPRW